MPALAEDKNGQGPAALERARQSVKMLDDLRKSAVVSITSRYVERQSDTPAAAVAKEIFEAMHQKGRHSARLVDATGKPRNKANLPRTAFEKKGAAAIKDGKAYVEEIGENEAKPVLRAATVVPAVLKQCIPFATAARKAASWAPLSTRCPLSEPGQMVNTSVML